MTISPDEFRELIEKARGHDESACQKILNLHKGRIFSYAYRMVKDYHDAEEITFDTFIKCFNALPSFDVSRPFAPWLFTIAHNLIMDRFRKRRGDVEYLDEFQPSDEDIPAEFEKKRQIEKIDQALLRLLPTDRELIILFHKEEHSYAEISEITGMPVTTIKTRLHRARKRLSILVREGEQS